MKNKKYTLPDILIPELIASEREFRRSIKFVEEHRDEIDKNISFIEAVELRNLGIDVTQLRKK